LSPRQGPRVWLYRSGFEPGGSPGAGQRGVVAGGAGPRYSPKDDTGRSALTGHQLLLVNLLTDVFPAMGTAIQAPEADAPDGLLFEGPGSSLGGSLKRRSRCAPAPRRST
jgi:hypothetical protein